jgi:GntR family transcriptional repressor for pyruvate dehydrogenase complex
MSVGPQVFEQLKNQILKGVWKPGDKIPSEHELTELLGVSRISVREALHKLAALGLIETRQGGGTFVKRLTADLYMNSLIPMTFLTKNDIVDVLEYRHIMEKGIVGLVVDRADANDIAELQDLLEKMKKCKGRIEQHSNYDLDFHLALARMTRNPIIIKTNYIIKDILTSSMVDIVSLLGTALGIYYHSKILDAIKRRDKEKAQMLMEKHIRSTIDHVLRQRREEGTRHGR